MEACSYCELVFIYFFSEILEMFNFFILSVINEKLIRANNCFFATDSNYKSLGFYLLHSYINSS